MQAQQAFKNLLPHLAIVAIFIAVGVIFCYPDYKGNTINQHDMFTWLQMSKESRDYHEQTGENAGWSNSMFSGMPLPQTDIYSPSNWYQKVHHALHLYKHGEPVHPAIHFILAMLCFYILMNVLRINRWLGAIGAVAFAFSTYNPIVITAGHVTKMMDIAYLPAIIAGVLLAYRGKYWQGAALTSVALALFFDAAHYQIIYYGGILIVVFIAAKFFEAVLNKSLKQWLFASSILLVGFLLALATHSSRFAQVQQSAPYTTRGGASELAEGDDKGSKGLDKDYAFRWSNGVGETFCLMVPGLYGGSNAERLSESSAYSQKLQSLGVPMMQAENMAKNTPLYWGPQPMLSGPVYFGAVIVFLFVLSFLLVKNRLKWWILGASVFFILLSLGNHFEVFNYFIFDYFPMYSKFRAPTMALVIPSILFPMMAAWGLKEVFNADINKEELWKKVKTALIAVGGLAVLILLATFMFLDYKSENDAQLVQQFGQQGDAILSAIKSDRASYASKDAFRSLLFILLTGGVIWAFAKNKINTNMAMAGIGLLVIFDILPVAHRYLNEDNYLDDMEYEAKFYTRPVDQQIQNDPTLYYRVFDVTQSPFNDPFPSLFHKSAGGYHGAKLQIYQDLIENHLGTFNRSVFSMLNIKYLIAPGGGQNKGEVIQMLPNPLGNAWFVNEIKYVPTARAEMDALKAPSLNNPFDTLAGNFNPETTAIVRETFKDKIGNYTFGKDSNANITLKVYEPNRLVFNAQNSVAGFAVFSDIYYPAGWTAYIDGKEAEIIRTNYVLRGLKVPAGNHEIEFKFAYPDFDKYENIALIGSILLTLLVLAALYFTFKGKKDVGIEK